MLSLSIAGCQEMKIVQPEMYEIYNFLYKENFESLPPGNTLTGKLKRVVYKSTHSSAINFFSSNFSKNTSFAGKVFLEAKNIPEL